ncbi:MAG: hypothetical protein ABIU77_06525 [Ferruginibacter sp.]
METSTEFILDYTNEVLNIPLEMDGVRTYASVNAEFHYDEDGLKASDNYYVYLLHPKFGSCHFMVDHDTTECPLCVNAPLWLEEEIIAKITGAISKRYE